MSEPFLLTRDGAVAIISINDAPFNRMSREFIDALEITIENIAKDETIRSFVITAEGLDHFSVGMDLKQLAPMLNEEGAAEPLFDQRLRVISAIETMGKPSVVTLFGYCLGGGLELPLGCHFRLAAAEGAQIGLPEAELGLTPAWGGSARLARCVGSHHAVNMILRGLKVSGPEAHRIGLVHEVVPLGELKGRAIQLAHELSQKSATAVREGLSVLVDAEEKSLDELLAAERDAVLACLESEDAVEGMQAFMEKRAPRFNQH